MINNIDKKCVVCYNNNENIIIFVCNHFICVNCFDKLK